MIIMCSKITLTVRFVAITAVCLHYTSTMYNVHVKIINEHMQTFVDKLKLQSIQLDLTMTVHVVKYMHNIQLIGFVANRLYGVKETESFSSKWL